LQEALLRGLEGSRKKGKIGEKRPMEKPEGGPAMEYRKGGKG
jgi:hypothetical protein